jgi:hypothetical protein
MARVRSMANGVAGVLNATMASVARSVERTRRSGI